MEQERIQREMQVAQEIQQTLLPRSVPGLEGFELGYLYRAAKEVGGDYFDFIAVDERTVGSWSRTSRARAFPAPSSRR